MYHLYVCVYFPHNDQLGRTDFPHNALSPQCIVGTYRWVCGCDCRCSRVCCPKCVDVTIGVLWCVFKSVWVWLQMFSGVFSRVWMWLQVFSGVFADDPMFVCEVMQLAVGLVDQQGARKSGKERQVATLNYCGHVLDVVTARHRLIDAAWETEILSKVSHLILFDYIIIHNCLHKIL